MEDWIALALALAMTSVYTRIKVIYMKVFCAAMKLQQKSVITNVR